MNDAKTVKSERCPTCSSEYHFPHYRKDSSSSGYWCHDPWHIAEPEQGVAERDTILNRIHDEMCDDGGFRVMDGLRAAEQAGYERGAREMRERTAESVDQTADKLPSAKRRDRSLLIRAADEIRALPLRAEGKTAKEKS